MRNESERELVAETIQQVTRGFYQTYKSSRYVRVHVHMYYVQRESLQYTLYQTIHQEYNQI